MKITRKSKDEIIALKDIQRGKVFTITGEKYYVKTDLWLISDTSKLGCLCLANGVIEYLDASTVVKVCDHELIIYN